MAVDSTATQLDIVFADEALDMRISLDEKGRARLVWVAAHEPGPRADAVSPMARAADDVARSAGLPLVDVLVSGSGRAWSGRRYVESVVGSRLCYVDHDEHVRGPWRELRVGLQDPVTGLRADVLYLFLEGGGVVRSRVRLTNDACRARDHRVCDVLPRRWLGRSRGRQFG